MPPDEEAFREYLATDEGQQFLERFGMASADELLVSERDGQPIVILYEGPSAGGVIAYERQGKDGRRMVVDNLGVNELLTEEEFRERVPDA